MSANFLKRDFPEIETGRVESAPLRRYSLALLLATHGLWLATSVAGLILSVVDAYPQAGSVLMASRMMEP